MSYRQGYYTISYGEDIFLEEVMMRLGDWSGNCTPTGRCSLRQCRTIACAPATRVPP
jgi:hypothetical protein